MRVETQNGGGGDSSLYATHEKVYPAAVSGRFRKIKWAILIATLGLYYLLPFVRWDRGPNAPDQAVLIDMPGRRFYFFMIEIWPQEVYYFTGLLVIAALTLFLMNAMAGRVWCGYMCPQTLWTDLYFAVERWVEGDRRERIKLDKTPWSPRWIAQKSTKHFLWIMIAWWTGGAWVLYFADAPTLVKDLATGQAPFVAYMFIGILTATTYLFAGFMREQVCIYMCPWPRIQAALTDEYALNVTYRHDRGEPRVSVKQAEKLRAAGEPAGDCVDCGQCVAVCPTGTDIRHGSQLSCIQCGLCIDACDNVMKKIGRPIGLVSYDTDDNMDRAERGEPPVYRPLRLRTVGYMVIIAAIAGFMVYTLTNRQMEGLNVLHDRNPLYVNLSNGGVRNGYTIRLLNKDSMERTFTVAVDGMPAGTSVEAIGISQKADGKPVIHIGPDQTREVRLLIASPPEVKMPPSTDITLSITDQENGATASASDYFKAPR